MPANPLFAPEARFSRWNAVLPLRTDLVVKAGLYARAGIAEYWVLDLNARQLHIHRAPANGEYTAVTVHDEAETVAFASRPETPIALADLLPPVSA